MTESENSPVPRRIAEPACTKDDLGGALRQGEILAELTEFRYLLPSAQGGEGAEPSILPLIHPFVVIVSQDCDLDWDYRLRNGLLKVAAGDKKQVEKQKLQHSSKELHSVLCVLAYDAGTLRGRGDLDSNGWRLVRSNLHERYQFLDAVPSEQDLEGKGLPELAIDFKLYLTIPTAQIYGQLQNAGSKAKRRTRLLSPYREQVQARMFAFQSRVALPQDHQSDPEG